MKKPTTFAVLTLLVALFAFCGEGLAAAAQNGVGGGVKVEENRRFENPRGGMRSRVITSGERSELDLIFHSVAGTLDHDGFSVVE